MNAMNNALTPAEKYERQKELARLRQKRFYEKNSEIIKQKKKSDRMELKQLRTQMVNTQINPPIVPAPAPKRTALDDLAQYASDDEYEEPTQQFEEDEEYFLPENEPNSTMNSSGLSLKKASIPLKNGHRRNTNLL